MVTLKAVVLAEGERQYLDIDLGTDKVRIPLSDDNPSQVKSAFNKLIARIKEGEFQITLDVGGEDLFSEVAKEYLTQLNREIHEIRGEMKQLGLVAD